MNNSGLYDLAHIEVQLNMLKEQHDNDIKYICESLGIKTPRELKAQKEEDEAIEQRNKIIYELSLMGISVPEIAQMFDLNRLEVLKIINNNCKKEEKDE